MTDNSTCLLCNAGDEEDIDHVLRKCDLAKLIWSSLVPQQQQRSLFELPLEEWLKLNLNYKNPWVKNDQPWASTFGLTCWRLWDRRNKRLFSNSAFARERLDERGGLLDDLNPHIFGIQENKVDSPATIETYGKTLLPGMQGMRTHLLNQ